jgi:transcription antitermination factor NusG
MMEQWYALRSKPRKEDIVWRQARSQGFETFFPRLKVNPVNPRARKLVPYFPGYLFVHVNLEEVGLSVFQWMPHSTGLVSFGGEPAYVPDHLIYELQKHVLELKDAGGEVFLGLKQGDRVLIEDGPFKGYEAIFDVRLPGTERVRVLLEMLGNQRNIPIELDAGIIRRRR